MAHCPQVVDFGRLDLRDDSNEIGRVTQITVMQKELHTGFMAISVNVVDTTSVETRGTTDNTMDLRKLVRKK